MRCDLSSGRGLVEKGCKESRMKGIDYEAGDGERGGHKL